MDEQVDILCQTEGINRAEILSTQLLFITHYRCSKCKLMPMYRLDMSRTNRARCGRCGHLISFKRTGKFVKLRKKLAVMVWRAAVAAASAKEEHAEAKTVSPSSAAAQNVENNDVSKKDAR
jgi:DNA-directed RNA polymerase subunit RPC12/RpoP